MTNVHLLKHMIINNILTKIEISSDTFKISLQNYILRIHIIHEYRS